MEDSPWVQTTWFLARVVFFAVLQRNTEASESCGTRETQSEKAEARGPLVCRYSVIGGGVM